MTQLIKYIMPVTWLMGLATALPGLKWFRNVYGSSGLSGYTYAIPGEETICDSSVSFVTVTSTLPTNSTGYTSTILPSGTSPGEVVIGVPSAPFVTITSTLPAGATGYTSTLQPSGTSPGEVVIGQPSLTSTFPGTYTTITTGYSANISTTVTLVPSAPDETGAGVIETPSLTTNALSTITITSGSFDFTSTVSTTDASSLPTSIVVVGIPTTSPSDVTTTITSGSVGFTSTISSPEGDKTIIINVPCSQVLGFNYSIYDNPFIRGGTGNPGIDPYANFDPTAFVSMIPLYQGQFSGTIGFNVAPETATTIYASPNVVIKQKAIVVTTYLYSSVAQTIKISPGPYDIDYTWTGATAISGYTVSNWLAKGLGGILGTVGQGNTAGTITVAANSYTPLLYIYGASRVADMANIAATTLTITGSVTPPVLITKPCSPVPAFPEPLLQL